jgi:hypothetical protein
MLMKLNYYRRSWSLYQGDCPCDLHFIQYLEQKKLEGKMIFHFGTGEHHLVGKNNHERGNPNELLAITASREEYEVYIDYIIDTPVAANYYKALFADIYTLSPRMLPSFDIVTLFHLCEYFDEREYKDERDYNEVHASGDPPLNSSYARLDDVKLLEVFLSKLNPGGRILFFKQSCMWDPNAVQIVDTFISEGRMIIEDEYESLLICSQAR